MGDPRLVEAQLGLDGVTEGVAEIEQGAPPGLPLVLAYDGALDLDRSDHGAGQGDRVSRGADRPLVRQPVEKGRVADQAVFQHLGPARAQLARRQGGQQFDVGHDQPGLVKRADQILPLRGIDRRLAAHRGIDLGQQGGRDLHEIDPAHVERRRQPREVADHPAAQRHDQIAPVQPEGQHPVDHPLQFGKGFGCLARRHGQQSGANPGGLQRRQHRRAVQGGDGLVGDDHRSSLGQRRDPPAQVGHQVTTDNDVIGLEAAAGDADHRVHAAASVQ